MPRGVDAGRHPNRVVDRSTWQSPMGIAAPSLDAHLTEVAGPVTHPPAQLPDPAEFEKAT